MRETPAAIGFPGILALVFIVLKLLGKIAWSWWWVLSPLLIPFLVWLLVFGGMGVFLVICEYLADKRVKKRQALR